MKNIIARSTFLSFRFSVMPYVLGHNGPSTEYNESVHLTNKSTNIQLNFWWSNGKVSVGIYDSNEKHEKDRIKIVLHENNKIDNNIISELCKKHLS